MNAARVRPRVVTTVPIDRLLDCSNALARCYATCRQVDAVSAAMADYARSHILDGEITIDPVALVKALTRMADAIRFLAEQAAADADAELAK